MPLTKEQKTKERKDIKQKFISLLDKNGFTKIINGDYSESYMNNSNNLYIHKDFDEGISFPSKYIIIFPNGGSRCFNGKEELLGFLILRGYFST